ncbi:type VI secretion system baseplate subunit TssG [Xanthobacteraceae bacterium A53D]
MGTDTRHRPAALAAPAGAAPAPAPAPLDVELAEVDVRFASFLALVRQVMRHFPDAPEPGAAEDPARERLRFRAHASLGYPPGEVAGLTFDAEAGRAIIDVNFLGLHGPSSPLPPALTERVIEANGSEGVPGQFLDFFNHRLIGLLVRISAHHRHDLSYAPGGSDPISQSIAALFGLMPSGGRVRRSVLLPYAGLLNCYSLSASHIASVIGHRTGLPVRIEEFVRRTVVIPAAKCSQLGEGACELGGDLVAGNEVVDVTGKFRVVIGPLPYEDFKAVLPDQPAFAAVIELVALSQHDPLAFDIRLTLAPGEVPAFRLDEGRLGWDTWLAPGAEAIGSADFSGENYVSTL